MSERWFLRLDGIAGDSTDDRHEDEIEVQSWSIGVSRSGSTTAGGSGAGRSDLQELQITAPLSAASPQIFLLAVTGRHLSGATLSGVRQGEHARDFFTIRLAEVTATRYRLGDEADAAPMDQFSLDYGRIEVTYHSVSSSGKPLPPVTAGFDVTHGSVL